MVARARVPEGPTAAYGMRMIDDSPSDQRQRAERFLALHHPERPPLLPNPWDAGSARLLTSLGFEALARTSSGFAATLGRLDGSVTRDEALTHAAAIVAATDVPVSADLENGSPTLRMAWPRRPSGSSARSVSAASVGGALAFAAFGALVEAARELRERGTYGFGQGAAAGSSAARAAFGQAG